MSMVVTATDDDVFRAFALGDELTGDTAKAVPITREHYVVDCMYSTLRRTGDTALYSHGVLLALRSEECVVFDARPCHDGGRCTCRYMADAARARKAAALHYATDEVCSLDHGAFVDLARRLGAVL